MLSLDVTLDTLRQSISRSGERDLLYLENNYNLVGALELRRLIPIRNAEEPLQALSNQLAFFSPHAYVEAGAPYNLYGPFFLRQQVVERLNAAQENLQSILPGARLKVFDGFRPKCVQIYMRELIHKQEAHKLGFDPSNLSQEQSEAAWRVVDGVWARPSNNPHLPTPHSTGAAVDLTIVDRNGIELSMGSTIDDSSERVLPSYYDHRHTLDAAEYANNRDLLRSLLEGVGFHRLSHEWWHFSYGDQFWALIESLRSTSLVSALYGEYT